MAKGKSVNPADAFRKAQRKKELKKNKEQRAKARDFALVKKDTFDLQDEIDKLSVLPEPSSVEKQRLKELTVELEKINKKKEEYVAEHPEQRKLVFRARRTEQDKANGDAGSSKHVDRTRKLFGKNGLPLHPERSIYYDPVLNPHGVPPPGMPYVERPLLPDEMGDADADSDDEIVMPEGPPPPGIGTDEEPIDSEDDIPMPDGPPPGEAPEEFEMPPGPPLVPNSVPPMPLGAPPLPIPPNGVFRSPGDLLPPPSGFPANFPPGGAQISSSGIPSYFPPPLAGLPPPPAGIPPPPAGFPPFPPGPPTGFAPPPLGFMPSPPPGFFPRQTSAGALQDPLAGVPHQTFQAHRQQRQNHHLNHAQSQSRPPPPPPTHPLPHNPMAPPLGTASVTATVSAEPELRDLKKESTAFVPASMRRKKATAGAQASGGKVNAAPSVGGEVGEQREERPDLVSALKGQFGDAKPREKGDYEKFVEEMGDILGAS
ncbi:WW domain binding protein 11-domain-containing protein [Vararia minispora EC-137]|uniref:WW domain binding protein 11-domain-containing protein n=1 Tax=Vararia minispora EC-137 TaxID=1314806 RepID=A0ACB8QKI1_9AGAM|nr:WW domain binding protein 11-domain-containing protein [Vararia minispora EC-137]